MLQLQIGRPATNLNRNIGSLAQKAATASAATAIIASALGVKVRKPRMRLFSASLQQITLATLRRISANDLQALVPCSPKTAPPIQQAG